MSAYAHATSVISSKINSNIDSPKDSSLKNQNHILVVEDERDVKDLLVLHLKRDGYAVTAVENGEEALVLIQNQGPYDLAVVDWMLPGLSGLDLCRAIGGTMPVLMVTARADSTDIVLGLEMGAHDYVTKPFDLPVFLARVRNLLKRTKLGTSSSSGVNATTSNTTTANLPLDAPAFGVKQAAGFVVPQKHLTLGDLHIDTEAYMVTQGGQEIRLTYSEFKLLVALAQNQGRVLSRERLIKLVQGEGVTVIDRAIDTHVFGLRKKLGSAAELIETIRGVGYRVRSV